MREEARTNDAQLLTEGLKSDTEDQYTARRSHGGTSRKFARALEGIFKKFPWNFSEVAFTWKSLRAGFWEGDATKLFFSEKKGFSVKRG